MERKTCKLTSSERSDAEPLPPVVLMTCLLPRALLPSDIDKYHLLLHAKWYDNCFSRGLRLHSLFDRLKFNPSLRFPYPQTRDFKLSSSSLLDLNRTPLPLS